MAKIFELKINNFRGIKTFSQRFNKDFVCLLGRGDIGKTTILDALSCVLSPSWNLSFYDSDFYNGKTDNPIEIEASLLDLPDSLIKEDNGFYIRGLDADNQIQDDLHDDHKKLLTVKMEVTKDLEPQWFIINNRQEPKRISAYDRAKLNVFVVSDYIDRHFSWSRGTPLYSILKEQHPDDEKSDVIIDALRGAKEKIDQYNFNQFEDITRSIKEVSSKFGIDLSGAKTTVDFKDISIKDGRVCLHDGDVPLRLKGKGSKRLISMAIQTVLAKYGGIMLIDEVEQGLEPDRVKHLVRSLKRDNSGQIFMTTHSSEVITELEAEDLMIVNNNSGEVSVSAPDHNFQDVIRACPEAGYAKKVIVCEGKTEIGICRALDTHRKLNDKEYMSFKDCVYTVGGGDSFTDRAIKLNKLGRDVCTFCDSDKDSELKPPKEDLRKSYESVARTTFDRQKPLYKGLHTTQGSIYCVTSIHFSICATGSYIEIFDCEENNRIEQQVFQDLPWEGVKELIAYVIKDKEIDKSQLKNAIKEKYKDAFPANFLNEDTSAMRTAIGSASCSKDKKKAWFKRVDHGEFLGTIIFKYFDQMGGKKLKEQLEYLSNWIDK